MDTEMTSLARNFRLLAESNVQLYMDNYELSGEDYAQFKTEKKNAGWTDYMRARSQVDLMDEQKCLRRLKQTKTVRVRFNEANPQVVLKSLPYPEAVKHLSLAYNNLQGGLDLSRFKHLQSLTLSGNPDFSLTDSSLPETLRNLILSVREQRQLERTDFKQKFPEISLSQNGNLAFNLGARAFQEPEMIAVKGGKFQMGSKESDMEAADVEKPVHRVEVSDYAIGKYLITVEEFARFVHETGYVAAAEREGWSTAGWWRESKLAAFCPTACNWRHDVYGRPMDNSYARHPVVHISWNDAMAYCEWLSEKTGRAYGLPTEAQWEYAAIGGHKASKDDKGYYRRKFSYAGSDKLSEVGWFLDQFEGIPPKNYGTRPSGSLAPNELGLYDMSGNVWEWCADRYAPDYYQMCKEAGVASNPGGSEKGAKRMFRGGGWGRTAAACRIANRRPATPDDRGDAAGFRLALRSGEL